PDLVVERRWFEELPFDGGRRYLGPACQEAGQRSSRLAQRGLHEGPFEEAERVAHRGADRLEHGALDLAAEVGFRDVCVVDVARQDDDAGRPRAPLVRAGRPYVRDQALEAVPEGGPVLQVDRPAKGFRRTGRPPAPRTGTERLVPGLEVV